MEDFDSLHPLLHVVTSRYKSTEAKPLVVGDGTEVRGKLLNGGEVVLPAQEAML